jgi:hypothetical protein
VWGRSEESTGESLLVAVQLCDKVWKFINIVAVVPSPGSASMVVHNSNFAGCGIVDVSTGTFERIVGDRVVAEFLVYNRCCFTTAEGFKVLELRPVRCSN